MKYSQELYNFRAQVLEAKNFDPKPYLKQIDKLIIGDRYLAKQTFVGIVVGLVLISYGVFNSWDLLTLDQYSQDDPAHFSSHDWEEGYYKFEGTLLEQNTIIKESNIISNILMGRKLTYYFTPVVPKNYKAGEKVHLLIPIQQSRIDRTEKEFPDFRKNATPIPLKGKVKRDASQEVIDGLLKMKFEVDENVGVLHPASVKKDTQIVLLFTGIGTALILSLKLIGYFSRRSEKKKLNTIKKEVSQFGFFKERSDQ